MRTPHLTPESAQTILETLLRARRDDPKTGGWVYAQEIADRCRVTTNAVQQAVSRLRRQGLWIQTGGGRYTFDGLRYRLDPAHQ